MVLQAICLVGFWVVWRFIRCYACFFSSSFCDYVLLVPAKKWSELWVYITCMLKISIYIYVDKLYMIWRLHHLVCILVLCKWLKDLLSKAEACCWIHRCMVKKKRGALLWIPQLHTFRIYYFRKAFQLPQIVRQSLRKKHCESCIFKYFHTYISMFCSVSVYVATRNCLSVLHFRG